MYHVLLLSQQITQRLQTHGKLLVTMVLHLAKGHASTQSVMCGATSYNIAIGRFPFPMAMSSRVDPRKLVAPRKQNPR